MTVSPGCNLVNKFQIGTTTYMFGFTPSLHNVDELYRKRWQVELSFRRLKSNLNLNYTFARSPRIWEQHVEARVLLDTISMTPQCDAEKTRETCTIKKVKRRFYPKRVCYLMSNLLLVDSSFSAKLFHSPLKSKSSKLEWPSLLVF